MKIYSTCCYTKGSKTCFEMQSFAVYLLPRTETSQSQCVREKHIVNLTKAKQIADHRARSEITKQTESMTNAKI